MTGAAEATRSADAEMKGYQVAPSGAVGCSPEQMDTNDTKQMDVTSEFREPTQTQVYRRRWFMLAVFVLVSSINAFHWIQFSIITNVVMTYYGVDGQSVNWTSLVFMVAYIPLIFPGAWIMDKYVRTTLPVGLFSLLISPVSDSHAIADVGNSLSLPSVLCFSFF